jgi:stage II sporulation protein D
MNKTMTKSKLKSTLIALLLSLSCLPTTCISAQAFCQPQESIEITLYEAQAPLEKIAIAGNCFLTTNSQSRLSLRSGDNIVFSNRQLNLKRANSNTTTVLADTITLLPQSPSASLMLCQSNEPQNSQNIRQYKGIITITNNRINGFKLVNKCSKFDYICGVVASESLANSPTEALKVQAVLAQTVMFTALQKGIAIGDSTAIQNFKGIASVNSQIRDVVKSVWGQYLSHNHQAAKVYYHSTCAGQTTKQGIKEPYIVSTKCLYCKNSPFMATTVKSIPISIWNSRFDGYLPKVSGADPSGRPALIALSKGRDTKYLTGYDFWIKVGKAFGWDKIPGTKYSIAVSKDSITFSSTGAGHGWGLCQWGAQKMANCSTTYDRILQFYFPTLAIESAI